MTTGAKRPDMAMDWRWASHKADPRIRNTGTPETPRMTMAAESGVLLQASMPAQAMTADDIAQTNAIIAVRAETSERINEHILRKRALCLLALFSSFIVISTFIFSSIILSALWMAIVNGFSHLPDPSGALTMIVLMFMGPIPFCYVAWAGKAIQTFLEGDQWPANI